MVVQSKRKCINYAVLVNKALHSFYTLQQRFQVRVVCNKTLKYSLSRGLQCFFASIFAAYNQGRLTIEDGLHFFLWLTERSR